MDAVTFEHETPPPGFDLSGEDRRFDEARATGITTRSVLLELEDDDDALHPRDENGDAVDDDVIEDADAAPAHAGS